MPANKNTLRKLDYFILFYLVIVLLIDFIWLMVSPIKISYSSIIEFSPAIIAYSILFISIPHINKIINKKTPQQQKDINSILFTFYFISINILLALEFTVLQYLSITVQRPLISNTLDAIDKTINFNLASLNSWIESHHYIRHILQLSYASIIPQHVLIIFLLAQLKNMKYLYEFTINVAYGITVTVILFLLFPAQCAPYYYNISNNLAINQSHFQLLYTNNFQTIDLLNTQGLISMPSFHSISAIIFIYHSTRLSKALMIPIITLNILMLIATPSFGGHYLIDVLAGICISLLSISVTKKTLNNYNPTK